ncbi:hypothetical protein HYALB_00000962 [Hymenoscyphus albidus]|uniref:Uncharacterized protein n=1 Tax=Hymenoscyphus albidus TaxID=595503 RepID=A0A9N9LZH8_9HELO|nr:hypothetical protein HYALB_00000962 [Hymenoscyphus albidus]
MSSETQKILATVVKIRDPNGEVRNHIVLSLNMGLGFDMGIPFPVEDLKELTNPHRCTITMNIGCRKNDTPAVKLMLDTICKALIANARTAHLVTHTDMKKHIESAANNPLFKLSAVVPGHQKYAEAVEKFYAVYRNDLNGTVGEDTAGGIMEGLNNAMIELQFI